MGIRFLEMILFTLRVMAAFLVVVPLTWLLERVSAPTGVAWLNPLQLEMQVQCHSFSALMVGILGTLEVLVLICTQYPPQICARLIHSHLVGTSINYIVVWEAIC